VGSLIFSVKGLHVCVRILGLKGAAMAAHAVAAAGCLLLPCTVHWASATMIYTAVCMAGSMQRSTVCAFGNNAVPADQRGLVNGVAVTFEAIAKGISPLVSATCFAWLLEARGSFGHLVAFWCLSCCYVVMLLGTSLLGPQVEHDSLAAGTEPEGTASDTSAAEPPRGRTNVVVTKLFEKDDLLAEAIGVQNLSPLRVRHHD